jgi:hypothetical protein
VNSSSFIPSVKRVAPRTLTTKAVAALKPGQVLADGYIRPGAGSLKARRRKTVGGGAAPEFIFLWQAEGKARSMVLGRYSPTPADGALTLDQARARAGQLQDTIRLGQDPLIQRDLGREAARAEQAAAVAAVQHGKVKTLQALMDAYLDALRQREKDASAYDTANVFLNHCTTPFPDIVGL